MKNLLFFTLLFFTLLNLNLILINCSQNEFLENLNKNLNLKNNFNKKEISESCGNFSCSWIDDECDSNFASLTTAPTGNKPCAQGLYCVNKTCIANNEGQKCAYDNDCYGGTSCIQDICDYYRYANDECDDSKYCYGNMLCKEGVCVGLTEGTPCLYNNEAGECEFNYYCSNYTCTKQSQPEGNCDTDEQCVQGCFCLEGTCKVLYNSTEGKSCSDTFSRECEIDLRCVNGKCTSFDQKNPDDDKCESSTPGCTCSCLQTYGEFVCIENLGFEDSCNTKLNDMYECSNNYNCSTKSVWDDNSCIYIHCKSKTENLATCVCSQIDEIYKDCYYYPVGDCSSNSLSVGAIIAITIIVIVSVALIVGIIGFVIYKRKAADYEQIDN
eukprot:TRINITY_DN6022_c0_g2_i1.p1 TRINITY_DN6022_c0_g2~~TRINITY_DN6022_c0_g2_i1.p1  ORF type:complete len:383 (-),score=142.77 TRINITY_DN6022_c0_g2_i1:179-1327(-)